jgi:CTP synthase
MLVGTDAEPQKTKPMQNGVQEVRMHGLTPDLLVIRSKAGLSQSMKEKISGFAQLELDQVIDAHDVSSTFRVPLLLEKQGVLDIIIERLGLGVPTQIVNNCLTPTIENWSRLVDW